MDECNPFLVKGPRCLWVVSQIHMASLSVHFAVWANWRTHGRRHQPAGCDDTLWRPRSSSCPSKGVEDMLCEGGKKPQQVQDAAGNLTCHKTLWYSCFSCRCYSAFIAGSVQRWHCHVKTAMLLQSSAGQRTCKLFSRGLIHIKKKKTFQKSQN